MDDAAVNGDAALKSISHVVKPFFLSGGDIGRPEVAGTVNDIAAIGVKPFALAYARMLKLKLVLLKDTLC